MIDKALTLVKTETMPESIVEQIKLSLRDLNPDLVILFGSRSGDNYTSESDVDLVVVLPEDQDPASFRERMNLIHPVRKALGRLNCDYAFDLLVYTRPQWKQFLAKQSWFSKEIQDKGLRIA